MTPSITLSTEDVWRRFHPHMPEMIITKEKGRKMFPKLEYSVSGLIPEALYIPVLLLDRCDTHRYKYSAGEWQLNGKGEPLLQQQPQSHCEGVATGRQLMQKKISFDDVRLTNNPDNFKNMVQVQSMHKYQPILSLYQVHSSVPEGAKYHDLPPSSCQLVASCQLELTQFIAVTAYFNEAVKKLKIELNPYAKGHKEDKGFYPPQKTSPSPAVNLSPLSAFPTPETSPQQSVPNMPMFPTAQQQQMAFFEMQMRMCNEMNYNNQFYQQNVPDYTNYSAFPYPYQVPYPNYM